jgi:hypothetical protein
MGPGRPPLSGNPGGRSKKKLHALLVDALSEPVFVTVDRERRKITKREAVVHQLVNKSVTADLRATKMPALARLPALPGAGREAEEALKRAATRSPR